MLLRPTYKSHGDYWIGVIKDDGNDIAWVCPHLHHNRDQGSRFRGPSAMDCARSELTRIGAGEDERGFIEGRARWRGKRLEVA